MGVIPQADGLMMPRISTNKATSVVSVNYSCDNYSHRWEKMVGPRGLEPRTNEGYPMHIREGKTQSSVRTLLICCGALQ